MDHLVSPFPYSAIRDAYVVELELAEKGAVNSLPFIRNPLSHEPLLQQGPFQALVIGGTHYESHLAELKPDGTILHLSTVDQGRLPLLETKEIFLRTIHEHIIPTIQYVSLNLAFPVKPVIRNGILDGELAFPSKGHTLRGLIDKPVGSTIEEYVSSIDERKIKVIVANDTTCLVLAGLQIDEVTRDNVCGVVVGSGYNMGFFLNENTIINVEAANFNRFTQSETGKIVDANSANPGKSLFEKEISGLYLYQHYNILKKQHRLRSRDLHDSEELSVIAATGTGTESKIARELLQRSASLVAAQIAGLYIFKGKPKKLYVIPEGSVVKKGWHYELLVKQALSKLGIGRTAISFRRIRNSSLGGAVGLATVSQVQQL